MSYDCFISYASGDQILARDLHRRLVAEGFTVWFDEARLRPGCDWHHEIEAGCESSRVVLPVLTPRWRTSDWTKYESYGAEAIVPLVFEGEFVVTNVGGIDEGQSVSTPPLRRWQACIMRGEDATSTYWARLFTALRELLARPVLDATMRARRTAHLPFRPTQFFVGRERDLERIHEKLHVAPSAALTQGQVQVIAALGGVGKTTLARMYAEKFWRCYRQIFWVDARRGYESEFARVCDLLLPEFAQAALRDAPAAQKARRAIGELETRPGPCLLVIDNAEDEASAAAWIPKAGDTHTLVTSRYAHWQAIATCHIFILEPEPARVLLIARSGRSDTEAVTSEETQACDLLAGKLGYLPLALEQAAAYMRQQGRGFGFRDYVRLATEAEGELLAQPVLGTTEYPAPVLTTWRTTLAKLPAGARALLRLAAFMAPTPSPMSLWLDSANVIAELASQFSDTPRSQENASSTAEMRVRGWRAALANYSMVTNTEEDGFVVHPLVQAVERHQLDRREQDKWLSVANEVFIRHAPLEADSYEHMSAWRTLFPHAKALFEASQNVTSVSLGSELVSRLCLFNLGQGRYDLAVPLARQALEQNEVERGSEDVETLRSVNVLADALRLHGDYAGAEPQYRRALSGRERMLGLEHLDTLRSVSGLAFLLRLREDYMGAEPLYRRALHGREQQLGPGHPDTLWAVNGLGVLLDHLGDYAAAESLFRRAVTGRERALDLEHPDTMWSVYNLAGVLMRKGDLPGAEPLFRRALAGWERVLGSGHPHTLWGVNGLAGILSAQGDHKAAEPLFRRALASRVQSLGWRNPNTLLSLCNLAIELKLQNNYLEAEPMLRQALEGFEATVGRDNSLTRRARTHWEVCRAWLDRP
jgi:tetratricopeptide (TPR) repeat protein